jgi:hypothetical protein
MRPFLIIMFSAALLLTSCSRQTRASYQLYTEDDVQKFVQPGTPLANIIQRFGQPSYDEKNPKFEGVFTNVDEIVYFNLPDAPPGTKEDFAFSGFVVRLKAGQGSRLVIEPSDKTLMSDLRYTPNFCCSECTDHVSVSIWSSWRRIAERFR